MLVLEGHAYGYASLGPSPMQVNNSFRKPGYLSQQWGPPMNALVSQSALLLQMPRCNLISVEHLTPNVIGTQACGEWGYTRGNVTSLYMSFSSTPYLII